MEAKAVTQEVEIDLQQYWLILRRRWLVAAAVFGSVVGLTILSVSLKKPVYEATGKLALSDNKTSSLTSLSGTNQGVGNLTALTLQSNPSKTEAEAIRSDPVVMKAITALNLTDQQGNLLDPEVVLAKLKVTNLPATDVLEVKYKSNDPEEAAAVVNKVLSNYLELNLATNRAQARAAREFLEKQLPILKAKVLQADKAVLQFEEANKVVNLASQGTSLVETEKELTDQLTQAESELAKANTRTAALRQQVGMNLQKAKVVNTLSESSAVQEALQDYQKAENELASARTRYQDDHPTVIDLTNQVTSYRETLEQRVGQVVGTNTLPSRNNLQTAQLQKKLTEQFVNSEVDRLSIASQVKALSNQRAALRQEATVIPKLRYIQQSLLRQQAAADITFQTLLKQLQEAKLTENQNLGNARILQNARVPSNPVAPRKVLLIAGGSFLGMLLAVGIVFVLEALDKSVKTVKEVRELFNYTVLGTIPSLKGSKKVSGTGLERPTPTLVVRDQPRSSISEAYRMLQANLKFLSSDKQLKVFAITSSLPKEGKSTVSANLAVAMSQLGHRVLLVDADMRRPSQHQIWEASNAIGLSDVLAGQASIETAVQKDIENLHLLTAGTLPPNPLALLDSQKMAWLTQTLSEAYDYVIVDTPPLEMAADALVLGKMVDGVLMVVRPGVVDSARAMSAKEALEKSDQNILGLVVNGIIPENEPDSYYYYYAKEYYTEHEQEVPLPVDAIEPQKERITRF